MMTNLFYTGGTAEPSTAKKEQNPAPPG